MCCGLGGGVEMQVAVDVMKLLFRYGLKVQKALWLVQGEVGLVTILD